MKKPLSLVSLILCILTIGHNEALAFTKALYMGTVQFPKDIKIIPPVRVYCAGNKIKAETNDTAKRITFAVPSEDKRRSHFTLIITETIQFESEENTIKYLKIKSGQSYKFYSLELVKKEMHSDDTEGYLKPKEPTYEWVVQEQKISLIDGHIPDDAIIICFKPDYVKSLEGGNAVEFPKIIIKNDILQLAGSEAKLDDLSIKLLLSSLDSDAIHANLQQEVKQDYQRTRITLIS